MNDCRQAILNSAMKLFARKGYAGTSTREICAGAGITKPALYYHFRSKEHLYQELMIDCVSRYRKELLRSAKFNGNLRSKLVSILETHFRETRKDPLCSQMMLQTWFGLGDKPSSFDILGIIEEEHALVAGAFQGAIEAGEAIGEPGRLATVFMGISLCVIAWHLLATERSLTRESTSTFCCADAA